MDKMVREGREKFLKLLQQTEKTTTKNWTKSGQEETKSGSVLSLSPVTSTLSPMVNDILKSSYPVNMTLNETTGSNQTVYNSSSELSSPHIKKQLLDTYNNNFNLTMSHNNDSRSDVISTFHNNGGVDILNSGSSSSSSAPSLDDVAFILIPLIIIMAVALFSGCALVCMQRRRKLDRLRHRLIPIYKFHPNDENEWQVLTNRHKNSESSSE